MQARLDHATKTEADRRVLWDKGARRAEDELATAGENADKNLTSWQVEFDQALARAEVLESVVALLQAEHAEAEEEIHTARRRRVKW